MRGPRKFIVGFLLAMLLALGIECGNLSNLAKIDTQEKKLYSQIFREPFESVAFVFTDRIVVFTTHDVDRVGAEISYLLMRLHALNLSPGMALVIVHNHLYPQRFSDSDISTLRYLKHLGFHGRYLIYYPFSGNVLEYQEK